MIQYDSCLSKKKLLKIHITDTWSLLRNQRRRHPPRCHQCVSAHWADLGRSARHQWYKRQGDFGWKMGSDVGNGVSSQNYCFLFYAFKKWQLLETRHKSGKHASFGQFWQHVKNQWTTFGDNEDNSINATGSFGESVTVNVAWNGSIKSVSQLLLPQNEH